MSKDKTKKKEEKKMEELLKDLVERATDYIKDGEKEEDAVNYAIDDGMIYTDDQWTAYRYYCKMGDSKETMFDRLYNDVYGRIKGGDVL